VARDDSALRRADAPRGGELDVRGHWCDPAHRRRWFGAAERLRRNRASRRSGNLARRVQQARGRFTAVAHARRRPPSIPRGEPARVARASNGGRNRSASADARRRRDRRRPARRRRAGTALLDADRSLERAISIRRGPLDRRRREYVVPRDRRRAAGVRWDRRRARGRPIDRSRADRACSQRSRSVPRFAGSRSRRRILQRSRHRRCLRPGRLHQAGGGRIHGRARGCADLPAARALAVLVVAGRRVGAIRTLRGHTGSEHADRGPAGGVD
jgi:hypothetical protein